MDEEAGRADRGSAFFSSVFNSPYSHYTEIFLCEEKTFPLLSTNPDTFGRRFTGSGEKEGSGFC
jgi:hypothetical protein